MALTRRQREIYEFIRGFVAEKGYSPSLEEIAEAFGLSSVATVHKHIQHLVEKRMLRKAWNRSRSIEPVEPPSAGTTALPLLGRVAAGAPIEAIEVPETIDVPRDLVGTRGESFVLEVSGDSMIEDQICDGDYVVVESRAEARDGETVVALVRGRGGRADPRRGARPDAPVLRACERSPSVARLAAADPLRRCSSSP